MQGHVVVENFSIPRASNPTPVAQLRPKPENAIFEVILLPLIVPFLAWLMGREDIFFLQTPFPWMILIPTLTASRYGTRYGLLSLFVMSSLSLLYVIVFNPALLTTLSQILVGSLLVVLVIGEMIQYWGNRTEKQAKELEDYRRSASESDQALQLLHISYSQLEEDLVAENQSLANSLRLLNTSITRANEDSKSDALNIAVTKMREILSHYPWLEAAAFYRIDKQGQLHPNSLGSIGLVSMDSYKDPLVREAIHCKQAVSIKSSQLIQQQQLNTKLQAAIPLLDSNGRLWGVMAVCRMSSSAMTQQNLNLLALLCNYVSNLLDNTRRPVSNAKKLLQEMYTALNIVLNSVRTATLITMTIRTTDDSDAYKDYFIAKVRGANRIWRLQRQESTILIILLPLFNVKDFKKFQENLANSFIKRFGKDFPNAGISLTFNPIRNQMQRTELQNYLVSLGKFDDARLIR